MFKIYVIEEKLCLSYAVNSIASATLAMHGDSTLADGIWISSPTIVRPQHHKG